MPQVPVAAAAAVTVMIAVAAAGQPAGLQTALPPYAFGAPGMPEALHIAEELHITTRVDRPAVRYPSLRPITFRIKLTTGGRAVTFPLSIALSRFETRRAGVKTSEGATMESKQIYGRAPFQLTGNASSPYFSSLLGQAACSPVVNAPHGTSQFALNVMLSMPANATATLTVPFVPSAVAPWPGDEHQIRVIADRLPGDAASLTRRVVTSSARVAIRGTTGTRIELNTSPPTYVSGSVKRHTLRLGRPIAVRGTTDPPLRDGTITLRHVPPKGKRPTLLARVPTDAKGRFSYRWTPERRGIHELWAFSPTGRNRAADYTCPIAIRIT